MLLKLELYSPDELSRIIQRSAGILDQPITPEGAYELAKCSRGTPRVANRFLKRVRDFATVLGDGIIDPGCFPNEPEADGRGRAGSGRAGPQPAPRHH